MNKTLQKLRSRRALNLLGFILCLVALIFGVYLEKVQGLRPCPLCILQRFAFVFMGILFFMGALYRTPGAYWRKIMTFLVVLFSSGGAALAARQVWLQRNPLPTETSGQCLPGLDHVIINLPKEHWWNAIFSGDHGCQEVQWIFMNHTLPEWTLLLFVILGGLAIVNALLNWRQKT